MSFINYKTKEIHITAVYFGPADAPLEQNVDWVFKQTASPNAKRIRWPGAGPVIDALPVSLGDIRGFHPRVYLTTATAGSRRRSANDGLGVVRRRQWQPRVRISTSC
jgi:hypothetical protein